MNRKNRWRFAIAVVTVLCAQTGSASSDISNTTVVDVSINRDYGPYVFIRVATAPANPAACSSNGYWHYTLPLSGDGVREIYSMLLTAHVSGATVDLSGLGVCNEFASVESLRSLRVSK